MGISIKIRIWTSEHPYGTSLDRIPEKQMKLCVLTQHVIRYPHLDTCMAWQLSKNSLKDRLFSWLLWFKNSMLMFLTVYISTILDNWSKACIFWILLEAYKTLLFGCSENGKLFIALTVLQHWEWTIVFSVTNDFHQNDSVMSSWGKYQFYQNVFQQWSNSTYNSLRSFCNLSPSFEQNSSLLTVSGIYLTQYLSYVCVCGIIIILSYYFIII